MTTEKKGFSTATTITIAIILIIPFLIRSLAPSLEPYPAIVLPLGIGLFDITDGKIEILTTLVMAQNEVGEWERIEPRKFFEPIPPYYLHKIAESNFGLITQNQKEINTAFWGRVQVPRKPVTKEDVASSQQWIRNRLNLLGYQDSTLLLRRTAKTIDLKTDSILSNIILEEIEFGLD